MSLATNIQNLATRIATEFKAVYNNVGDLASLNTNTKASLVAAINEVAAASGAAPANLTDLNDVEITAPTVGQALVWDGTEWVNDDVAPPIPDASETVKGIVELATVAETATGTDGTRAVTPAGLKPIVDGLQPLDPDLTAIADLTTTAFGRSLLEVANSGALTDLLPSATETVEGVVELATSAEVLAGADAARAVTPAGLAASWTDRIDTSTGLGTSNAKVPSQNAVKAYVDGLIGANDAMVFKGVLDASSNPNYPAADAGHTYKISVAGRVGGAGGAVVEAGDMIICTQDGSAAGNQTAVGANWAIVQTNIDGAVTGPASSTNGNLATFNGATGKVIMDSGLSVSTSTALGASNTLIPTQGAVKAYADTKQPLDATLTALAGLATSADQMIYANGTDSFAMAPLSSYMRGLLNTANAGALRTAIDVYSKTEIGNPETDFVSTFEAGLV